MLKTTILTLIISITFNSKAQKALINWGEQSKKETLFGGLVLDNNGNFVKLSYLVKEGNSGFWGIGSSETTVTPILSKYDNKLNEINSNSIYTEESGYRIKGFIKLKNSIYIKSSKYDKDTKTTEFIAQPVNLNTLKPEGKLIYFGNFEVKKGGFFGGRRESSVSFELSKDSSKLLVFSESPFDKKENQKFYMAVYNSDINKIWEKNIELPYLDKFIDIEDFFITNNGEVCLVLKHYDKEVKHESIKDAGASVPAYKTKLLIYNNETNKPKEFILDSNGKFISSLNLTSDSDDNLNMFGTYKEKENGNVSGYFISTINTKNGAIIVKKMEAFPIELIDLVDEDDQGSKNKKDPGLKPYFKFKENLTRVNGSQDYILEFFQKTYEAESYDGKRWYSGFYTYTFGDIIDINITKDNKSTFIRIPKLQYTTNSSLGCGFKALSYKNKICFFYNDDEGNLDRDIKKKPEKCTNLKKSNFIMATVNENGELIREALYNSKDIDAITCIDFSMKLTENKISLYGLRFGVFKSTKDNIGYLELK